MQKYTKTSITAIFLITAYLYSPAQSAQPGRYNQLSKSSYSKQKDSLKKALVCPVLFKKKETQKKYKEFWDSRTDFITAAIDDNDFTREPAMYNYVSEILSELVSANREYIKSYPLLFIDRSPSVNAYAIGNNMVAVNMGLLSFSGYREEIALALAHELAHNILMHPENSMKERAELLTSDEYINDVKSVLDSKYGRYSKLKKIMEGYSFSHNRHTRYHEEEADSMATILLKNSKIAFAPGFFLRLDSADLVYKTPLKNGTKTYMSDLNINVEETWMRKGTKGLSNRNYSFSQGEISDSAKTHPDCKARYEKLLPYATGNTLTPISASLKADVNKSIIWSLFVNSNLTSAFYRLLLEKDRGNFDAWHKVMAAYIMNGLFYADKKLSRFNVINIRSKEYISSNYYELQTMFEQFPRDRLESSCKECFNQPFWQQASADERSFRSLLAYLNFTGEQSASEIKSMRKEFQESYGQSLYLEFIEQIK
ncbi:M48 family metalloprotease [Ferruginibacter sp. HRS2-29]|uniref:M48 family metalloprotease n=1 Tax=Ferruginibacter sp. HRS2-29 TaxID=2487334 RepID=UPI0020CE8158|nr:M48 family metalloprotease [Ferruginibacter sp. HRS2-29]